MGQIVGLKAKPKRCNLNALGRVPTPAAGEHILVSYDNSMTANGQGNFDRYIIGDGRTAATELELKYLDDSTRPYIVEEVNKAVADIQPIEITGDVTNAPDEEDLTSENQGGTDVLKFKDKAYNAALYSGLGCVYLRKNIVTLEGTGKNVLTQAMVNTVNTIYHIQYDYDLNGQTITLPAGCVLEFEGGSVKNGTLNFGKGVTINSEDVKIFDNITFTGYCEDIFFHIDWFVGNYAETIAESEPDATAEIQAMFDSGVKKVWLTNKRNYRITDTIEVDASILIDGDMQKVGNDNGSPLINKYIFGNFDAPLFKIVPNGYVMSVTIHNLYLYRLQSAGSLTSENNYKRDIPTLYVDCTNGRIWGFDLWAVFSLNKIPCDFVAADGETTTTVSAGGYRAIEVYVAGSANYIAYVKIGGYIHDYYDGLKIHKDDSASFITGVTLNHDSEGVYGGYVQATTIITGQHQTRHCLPSGNTDAYFSIDGECDCSKVQIWDTAFGKDYSATALRSVLYSISASYITDNILHDANTNNKRFIKRNHGFSLYGNANLWDNLLPAIFYGNFLTRDVGINNITFRVFGSEQDFESYIDGTDTTLGTDVLESNTFGFYDLFYPEKLYYDNITGNAATYNWARKSYVTGVAVKKIYLKCSTGFCNRAMAVVYQSTTLIESVVIKTANYTHTFNGDMAYFNPLYAPIEGTSSTDYVEFIITYKVAQTNVDIPYIGICGAGAGSLTGIWGGSVAGRLNALHIKNGVTAQKILYDKIMENYYGTGATAEIKLLHLRTSSTGGVVNIRYSDRGEVRTLLIDGNNVYVGGAQIMNGQNIKVYKNSKDIVVTSNFPYKANLINVDYQYSVDIIDDLSTIDLTGWTLLTNIVLTTSAGASSARPTPHARRLGQMYFDSTLGKPIFWNGTAWVDATGVPADNSLKVLSITQSAYDALATKDPNTLYIIS